MLPENTSNLSTYNTLDEIRQRKDQLAALLEKDTEQMGNMWSSLFTTKENSTKGEYIASLVANSVTAIDAFLLVRKLMKNYPTLFRFFGIGKKKTKKRR
ncbi:MAG: hypothetical protein IJ612_00330 [Prevotella sp.]|nr:hypothetical protein [Prevotella sp.]